MNFFLCKNKKICYTVNVNRMADLFLKDRKGASMFGSNTLKKKTVHNEGELYKRIEAHGKIFEIYYEYYDDADIEPMEMYPNFTLNPVYTADGLPFITAIQKPCGHFKGEEDEDNTCYQCSHYEKCEELLGVCNCTLNRERKNE